MLLMSDAARQLAPDILIKRAAASYIKNLLAAAYTENGLFRIFLQKNTSELQFKFIPKGNHVSAGP